MKGMAFMDKEDILGFEIGVVKKELAVPVYKIIPPPQVLRWEGQYRTGFDRGKFFPDFIELFFLVFPENWDPNFLLVFVFCSFFSAHAVDKGCLFVNSVVVYFSIKRGVFRYHDMKIFDASPLFVVNIN